MIIRGSNSLGSSDFRRCIFGGEVEGWDSSRSQGIEKIETIHRCQPSRLSQGEALVSKVMDSHHQAYFLSKLSRLFAKGKKKVVWDVYGDMRHLRFLVWQKPNVWPKESQETL